MARGFRWLWLVLTPWIFGCATASVVRLETRGRGPRVYTPPAEAKVVAVGQREFLETVSLLLLDRRVLLSLEREYGQVRPAAWRAGEGQEERDGPRGRVRLLGTASPRDARERFTLIGAASQLTDQERQSIALGYALDTVWDGVAQAVRGTVNPEALRAMISSALCAYMMLLVAPEPVTKFLAIALTAYLVAYVGCGPLWNMVEAYKELRDVAKGTTSLAVLEEAGHRFGKVMGDNGMRVAILVVLSAAGGRAGMAARGPTLPGYAQAALAAETNAGLRLAAVSVEGGVTSVSVSPGALIVGAAPSAVAMTAWDGGGGGPRPKGKLTGRPARPKRGNDNEPESLRGLQRENESAQTLADHGYDVEQRPPRPPNSLKNPDYRINGEYYDCYAPSTSNVRNIWDAVRKKVIRDQAHRIVLNLDDSLISLDALSQQFSSWKIPGLEEVLVVEGGRVIPLFPR